MHCNDDIISKSKMSREPRIRIVSVWYSFWNRYHQPLTITFFRKNLSAMKSYFRLKIELKSWRQFEIGDGGISYAVVGSYLIWHIRTGSKINLNYRKIFQAKMRFYGWKIGSFLSKKHIVFGWRGFCRVLSWFVYVKSEIV